VVDNVNLKTITIPSQQMPVAKAEGNSSRQPSPSGQLSDFCQPDMAMPRLAANTSRISLVI